MELVTILIVSALLLHVAIAVVLVRRYLRTRDAGLIWLGIAVVVWPLVSRMLQLASRPFIDRLVHHEWIGFYPFKLVATGQMTIGQLVIYLGSLSQLVGICLLFVAVLYLANPRNQVQAQS